VNKIAEDQAEKVELGEASLVERRLRFKVEYDGAAFHGWQVQPNGHTVQAELEQAFSTVLRVPVKVQGSGRTDAGVHARGQVAVAVWQSAPDKVPTARRLLKAINGVSNRSVQIRALEFCTEEFQPRFAARERYYVYTVFRRPVVLGRDLGWDLSHYNLDGQMMQQEAEAFLGEHDFDPFSIPRNDGKSTLCTLNEFRVEEQEDRFLIHIRGNRFLHRMVRSMVGLLADVGRAKHPVGSVRQIFAGEFAAERTWAPAQGLCLEAVIYEDY
jgi:tRNA pseudouridine38-40 synthase